jgi:hypothetical protein
VPDTEFKLQAVERTLPTVDVDDPDLVLRLTQGGRLPARDLDGPYAVRSTGQLIGIYRDRGDEGRPELVWTRPQER